MFRTRMGKKLVPVAALSRQLIAQRPSMISQVREVFCQGRVPASLTHVPPSRRLLCRFPLVILQQAAQSFPALHCSLFPSCLRLKRKQLCDFPCPDGSALHGNAANIAARLAAAKTLQIG